MKVLFEETPLVDPHAKFKCASPYLQQLKCPWQWKIKHKARYNPYYHIY